ncbi:Amino-acid acetyltransferase, mitochondrial [Talaromyces atroroseus]|uniref:Amino-acid acetyltransferase, mitochondrial n=1 Tax=Talaromyces atroroseus TaxID=1441469 RepID=A0A225AG89_TALAT|nr:Amino-acid acetyltransferase, mitochondrial [Talaromyces atroroseus]OKL57124.1 Amino-acid acetyltransferase, mitochondrial [Talaromyces atroroseus]
MSHELSVLEDSTTQGNSNRPNDTHDWSTCRNVQAQLRHRARSYQKDSQQAARKSGLTDPLVENDFKNSARHRAREKLADKEFFLSLLSSAATKREAKAYLSRFPSVKKTKYPITKPKQSAIEAQSAKEMIDHKPGVNLGSFYGATRSVSETPVFRQGEAPETKTAQGITLDEALHIALVKLTNSQSLDDETVHGVALTLSQLTRLGMASCVVVDPGPVEDETTWRKVAAEQADRLSAAIDACDGGKARRLDSVLTKNDKERLPKVISRQVLLRPLRKNHTVIVTPVAYSEETCTASLVSANDAVLALTRELAGLERKHDPDEDPRVTAEKFAVLQKEVAVDRLIVLDPIGGIPAFEGPQRSHVFINMEQEFEDIENELLGATRAISNEVPPRVEPSSVVAAVNNSNPISSIVASEIAPIASGYQQQRDGQIESNGPLQGHLDNLRLLQKALAVLPPLSSGIITTPKDVANSARPQQQGFLSVSQVGTRRQKNTLIHNLLTDKPVYSSSLPSARLGPSQTFNGQTFPAVVQSTFVKRGMPLTILPDPRIAPWSPENSRGPQRLTLDDPRIDLPRLVYLIEDSFNRKLDVQDYLDRIHGRIAGLIIAGEYEGGAILTWEAPPDIPESELDKPENIKRLVPYLDKFAVLKRSQGAGGVADVVFNAMVRSCLPQGVCWRSRMDNPVNKWYFERSRGTWKLNGSNWAMFWTTPGVPEEDPLKFRDYEAVCRSIQPSWADKKSVVD